MARKKVASGLQCITVGRALARTECGLAFAAQAITRGNSASVHLGVRSAINSALYLNRLVPGVAGNVMARLRRLERELVKPKKISASQSKKMLETVQDINHDVSLLTGRAVAACTGKK